MDELFSSCEVRKICGGMAYCAGKEEFLSRVQCLAIVYMRLSDANEALPHVS